MASSLFDEALALHQSGQFAAAEQRYRQILAADPNHADALHLLGLLAHQVGHPTVGVDLIRRAIQLRPDQASYFNNLAGACESLGRTDEALEAYQQALRLAPNFAEAHNNLGILLHALNRLPEAAMSYQRALQLRPDYCEAYNNLGNLYESQRRREEAVAQYRAALRIRPDLVAVRVNMANVLLDLDQHDEAMAIYDDVLRDDPSLADVYNFRANLWQKLGQFPRALEDYDMSLRLRPNSAAALTNRGLLYARMQRPDLAIAQFEEAIRAQANYFEAHANLGNTLREQGRSAEAEPILRGAIELSPGSAAAYNNLGNALQDLGRLDEACDAYRQALIRDPQLFDAQSNLGVTLYQQRQLNAALSQFREVLTRQPTHVPALTNLGMVLAEAGRFDEARVAFDTAQRCAPAPGRQLRRALLTRVIYDSAEQMAAERVTIANELTILEQADWTINDPAQEVGATTFHLAYHDADVSPLLSRIADVHLRRCPSLDYTAPHCRRPRTRAANAPLRVGFISRHLHDHPVGMHYARLIEQLSRERWQVIWFREPGKSDRVTRQLASRADASIVLPPHLTRARELVALQELDALVYPDVGMDPFYYFLAFARLAPVQVVAAGHPVTSGLPSMDYFLSSAQLEPPGAQGHYREQLVLLDSLPTAYPLDKPASIGKTRRDFQLPEGVPLYVCGQTLFKIHPDFDRILAALLARDPRGRVVCFTDVERLWGPLLEARWRRTLGEAADRVLLVPRVSVADFGAILDLADAVLDTIHFSGGTTSAQALAVGVPVVTLPGSLMRGRVTAASYRAIGVEDCIAASEAEYVELALRLAHEPEWRESLRRKIAAQRHKFFEHQSFVAEFEQFLSGAIAASRAAEGAEPR